MKMINEKILQIMLHNSLLTFTCLFVCLYLTNKLNAEPSEEIIIFDGGSIGWEKMSKSCGSGVDSVEIAVACLNKQIWTNLNQDEIEAQIEEGYISIGGIGVQPEETESETIKVFVFRQHAIDKDGNMYLYAQPG